VSKGERRSSKVGDGSPGSREAEGEGGEGFYIAQTGRRPNLLVSPGGSELLPGQVLVLVTCWDLGLDTQC
jgi:hypothetical protein